jgi:hypothetical protein
MNARGTIRMNRRLFLGNSAGNRPHHRPEGGLGSFGSEAFLAAGAKSGGVSRSIRQENFAHPVFWAMAAELRSGDAARPIAWEVSARFGRIDAMVDVNGRLHRRTKCRARL